MKVQRLRPYQTNAIEELRGYMSRGVTRLLLVSPTGSGKTTIASEIIHSAESKGRHILFLAHRKELIEQCSQRLDQFDVEHGVIKAGFRDREGNTRLMPWLPTQVASIQTLVRRELPKADLIIIDEAHRARAATYNKIIEQYPNAVILGLTATPWRSDGKGLGGKKDEALFHESVIAAYPAQLRDDGFLVPITGHVYDTIDMGVETPREDFTEEQLREASMGQRGRKVLGNVVDAWLEHGENRLTVCFACTVEHSQEIVRRFREQGVAAEHVDGNMGNEEREAILERLKRGETRIVSNVGILTEGWDLPDISLVLLARPTASISLAFQMIGRGLRTVACKVCGLQPPELHWRHESCPRCGTANPKRDCRIHDHAGVTHRFGDAYAERDYSLDADLRTAGKKERIAKKTRTCFSCFKNVPTGRERCTICGAVFETGTLQIKEVQNAIPIPIETVTARVVSDDVKKAELKRLIGIAIGLNRKIGWAQHAFFRVFRHWPAREWVAEYSPRSRAHKQQRFSAME